jgi:hypothetical protein
MAGVWPDSLVTEFGERRAALFLGAGVSAGAAKQFGLKVPTWPELLLDLTGKLAKKNAQEITRKLVRRGQMLDAAQILSDSIAIADLTKLLRDKFNIALPDDADIYKYLIAIDPTIMFTTNFDQFLETAYMRLSGGHGYNVCRYNEHHLLNDIRSPMRSLPRFMAVSRSLLI